MNYLPQILFLILLSVAGFFIFKSIRRIRKNILLGKPENLSDQPQKRFRNMLLMAFGQKKMFHKPVVAVLHLFIYVGFLIVNIEILEILIDGLFGSHRVFAPTLGNFYPWVINVFEFFAVAVIISCLVFLYRRNVLKVKRFQAQEMTKWPKLDANIILTVEILLMFAFLTMNATDFILQGRGNEHYLATGSFFFSGLISPLFAGLSTNSLIFIERFAWWFHIIGVMLFANYIFFNSKHLHIFLSSPNTYFARLDPHGKLQNMADVTREVRIMLNLPDESGNKLPDDQAPGRFGAKDVTDLSWKNLLDAYSCTECGRCTASCPANITGKKLSPRKIMMDTRDRLEEVGKGIDIQGKEFQDGKALLGDYITTEEIMACTTCQACVEACPVLIDPLNIIIKLRQFKIMEESNAPASWNGMFSNIENNFAPWKFSPTDRFNWSDKLKS